MRGEAEQVQQLVDQRGVAHVGVGRVGVAEREVVPHGEPGHQPRLLEEHADAGRAGTVHRAGARVQLPREEVQQRGLARPAGAEQGQLAAMLDIEVDPAHGDP